MRRGNCTFLVGVEDDMVEDALVLMRDTKTRSEHHTEQRALAFVLNADRYEQL